MEAINKFEINETSDYLEFVLFEESYGRRTE
jgi:hypothetical protein